MKKVFYSLLVLFFPAILFSQVVVSDPELPFDSQPVTIYFYASQGTAGLKDYSGDVYAHTGVLTDESTATSDWKYVKTNWGQNTPDTKLTRVDGETNLYRLDITPSIREYYGVPDEVVITHIAFVFRSDVPYTGTSYYEGKDNGGKDIFVEVFEEGLNISISEPSDNLIIEPDTDIPFSASSTLEATLTLILNDAVVKTVTSEEISHTFNFNESGDYWIKVTAEAGEETEADSVFVHILEEQPVASIPEGLEDGINYIDDNTVTLVLYAPNKEHVFVIGEFNDYTPSSAYRMKRDGNRYWLTLEDLEAGKEYGYQYFVDGEVKIGDPYADKVLDPWNDKWIEDSTYPNLKNYPSGLTDGIVTVFQTAQENYEWQHDYVHHEAEVLLIYELLVRDFLAAHDWKTLTDTLDYFTRLGVNAIELMPINEFEGNDSWGYNPSYYFAPDKYYGPKNQLKAFIDSCHGRGISVIQDMVFNHSFGQSPLVRLYMNEKGWPTAENPWYNEDFVPDDPNGWYQARHPYNVGYDFDHSSPQTQAFMDRANKYWIEKYHIDGYRFDLTKGFTQNSTFIRIDPESGNAVYDEIAVSNYDAERVSYLKRMADQIWNTNPDTYVILEHFTENSEEKDLAEYGMMIWGNLNSNYNEATMGYNESGKSNFRWISYEERGYSLPNVVGFMESHDEERLMYKNLQYGNSAGEYDITDLTTALFRVELAAAFFFTIPGPKMIWQFGEMGYDYSIDYNGRIGKKPIRWDYYNSRKRLRAIFGTFIRLKLNEPAFSTADFTLSVNGAMKKIELNHENMDVRIIGNFDVVEGSMEANFSRTGSWYDYLSGEEIVVDDVNMTFTLAPGEYKILTTKMLNTPDLPTSIKDINLALPDSRAYPNPVSEQLYITNNSEIFSIQLLDAGGRLLKEGKYNLKNVTLNVSDLRKGVYILKIIDNNNTIHIQKIVKQ